jgi:hypothetical protein
MNTKTVVKTITLPFYGIKVTLDDIMVGFGKIQSDLHNNNKIMGRLEDTYESAIDAIESLILAHAVAGVDIESPAYMEGIETAVDACFNNLL